MNIQDNNSVEFILKEISFFIEIFCKNNNDKTGLMIAKDINRFLKAGGDYESIIEFLTELETYSVKSNDDDFIWELVYARRFIVSTLNKIPEKSDYSVESSLKIARHFETICEITPSGYNQCCRILEYLNFGEQLKNPAENDIQKKQLIENFNYCEQLFQNIHSQQKSIYLKTAYYLYSKKYFFLTKTEDIDREKPDVISALLRYSFEFFRFDNNNVNVLSTMALAYIDYIGYSEFSIENEKENLRELLNWLEDAIKKGNRKLIVFRSYLKSELKRKNVFFSD